MATDRQREYQIECKIEALLEVEDIEAQYLPLEYDRLREMAIAILDLESRGALMRYTMVVVLTEVTSSRFDAGRSIYQAVQEQDAPELNGCRHPVDAVSLHWARIDAINLHQRICLGWR